MFDASKKILWVDDEIEFFRSHVVFLETRGYSVTTASGGDEAVSLVEANPDFYDLVLLDKQMPVKSGNATMEEIKEIRPDLPVVMLTGYQHSADIAMGKRYDAYLTKPIDPNRLLIACRQILDSKRNASRKLTDRYLRAYTDLSARAGGTLNAADWMGLYHSIVKWDIELDGAASDAVGRMHTGLKSDCDKRFCGFAAENYPDWVRGIGGRGRPPMPVDVLAKVVAPELSLGRGVLMFVLSGMRLDQFLCMEPELRRNFSVSGVKLMSLLPTLPNFSVAALASGFYPDEAAGAEPGFFEAERPDPAAMKRLMRLGLERVGAPKARAHYTSADGPNGRRHVRSAIGAMGRTQTFGVVAIDIIEKVLGAGLTAKRSKALVADESEFRRRVEHEFSGSTVLDVIKEACRDACTVILASGHGHALCHRASEVYETQSVGKNPRCLFCDKASVDERDVLLLDNLSHFRLPPTERGKMCLMARENFYLSLNGSRGAPPNIFLYGGISLSEMVTPLYVCRPLVGTAR
jgi:CheY-like chemotaxis protein